MLKGHLFFHLLQTSCIVSLLINFFVLIKIAAKNKRDKRDKRVFIFSFSFLTFYLLAFPVALTFVGSTIYELINPTIQLENSSVDFRRLPKASLENLFGSASLLSRPNTDIQAEILLKEETALRGISEEQFFSFYLLWLFRAVFSLLLISFMYVLRIF